MKKYIFLISFFVLSISSSSQIWIEGFTMYSMPMSDWAAKGSRTFNEEGQDPVTISNKEIFKYFADPQFGGGINLHYSKNKLIVGMELGYVHYNPATDYLSVNNFRIGPIIEFFFKNESRFQPYVGGEFGIQQTTIHYDKELLGLPEYSDTYFGIGPRAGLVFMFSRKTALRLGAKYIYMDTMPYLDISLGIAVNVGDF